MTNKEPRIVRIITRYHAFFFFVFVGVVAFSCFDVTAFFGASFAWLCCATGAALLLQGDRMSRPIGALKIHPVAFDTIGFSNASDLSSCSFISSA